MISRNKLNLFFGKKGVERYICNTSTFKRVVGGAGHFSYNNIDGKMLGNVAWRNFCFLRVFNAAIKYEICMYTLGRGCKEGDVIYEGCTIVTHTN